MACRMEGKRDKIYFDKIGLACSDVQVFLDKFPLISFLSCSWCTELSFISHHGRLLFSKTMETFLVRLSSFLAVVHMNTSVFFVQKLTWLVLERGSLARKNFQFLPCTRASKTLSRKNCPSAHGALVILISNVCLVRKWLFYDLLLQQICLTL